MPLTFPLHPVNLYLYKIIFLNMGTRTLVIDTYKLRLCMCCRRENELLLREQSRAALKYMQIAKLLPDGPNPKPVMLWLQCVSVCVPRGLHGLVSYSTGIRNAYMV